MSDVATAPTTYEPPAGERGAEDAPETPDASAAATPETPTETPEPAAHAPVLPKSITPPVKTGKFQERLSDLVKQRDSFKQENEQLRMQISQVKPADSAPRAAAGKDPDQLNPEDFPTYADYVTALVAKTMAQKEESFKTQRAQQDYERYQAERHAIFNRQAAPLAQEYGEGFWDAISDPSLNVTEAMADAVLELDDLGPYTMLYLAAHRDEATRIARMNPRAQMIAIGRLASQLDYEIKQGAGDGQAAPPSNGAPTTARTQPSIVNAPRGAVPSISTDPGDKDSVDEWLRKETDRLRRINPNARFYGAR